MSSGIIEKNVDWYYKTILFENKEQKKNDSIESNFVGRIVPFILERIFEICF